MKSQEDYSDLTIIIPTLNEEKNITQLIERVFSLFENINILIIDDWSTDSTLLELSNISNDKLRVINRSKFDNFIQGLCISIVDWINSINTEKFIVIDADGQHPYETIWELYLQLKKDNDLVIAVRDKYSFQRTYKEFIITEVWNLLARLKLLSNNKAFIVDPLSWFFWGKTFEIQKHIQNKRKFQLKWYKFLLDLLKVLPDRINIWLVYYTFNLRELWKSKKFLKVYYNFLLSLLK